MRFLICCVFLFSANAMANLNIAVFDMELAIQQTSDGKIAKSKLMKEFKFLESQLKKREFGLKEKVKDFEKKALILSEKKREQQRMEIQKLSMNFQRDMQKFQFDLQKKQLAATKPIIEKLQKHLSKIAEKKGYDLVLNKSRDQVLWSKKKTDITAEVVESYEKAS